MSLTEEVSGISNEIQSRVRSGERPTLVLQDIFLARYNGKAKIFHALMQLGMSSQEAMRVTGRTTGTILTEMTTAQVDEAIIKMIGSNEYDH